MGGQCCTTKCELCGRLFYFVFQELFPANKRDIEHLTAYFTEAGLPELASFLRAQQSLGTRMEMQKELQEKLQEGTPVKEVNH